MSTINISNEEVKENKKQLNTNCFSDYKIGKCANVREQAYVNYKKVFNSDISEIPDFDQNRYINYGFEYSIYGIKYLLKKLKYMYYDASILKMKNIKQITMWMEAEIADITNVFINQMMTDCINGKKKTYSICVIDNTCGKFLSQILEKYVNSNTIMTSKYDFKLFVDPSKRNQYYGINYLTTDMKNVCNIVDHYDSFDFKDDVTALAIQTNSYEQVKNVIQNTEKINIKLFIFYLMCKSDELQCMQLVDKYNMTISHTVEININKECNIVYKLLTK